MSDLLILIRFCYLNKIVLLKNNGLCVANMDLVLLCRRGYIYLHLIIMLLVGMSWADVLSVMLVRGVMCDVRYTRQMEAL